MRRCNGGKGGKGQAVSQLGSIGDTVWCNEIGSLTSLMHVTQVHPVTIEYQFHCTRLYVIVEKYCKLSSSVQVTMVPDGSSSLIFYQKKRGFAAQ